MTERAQRTRGALIEATIEEIERVGLAQITVRSIALRAGANVAAAHYHFGSKDGLVDAALEVTRTHMLTDAGSILAGELSADAAMKGDVVSSALKRGSARRPSAAREVLRELLTYLLIGALRYPRLTQAHIQKGSIARDFEAVVDGVSKVIRSAVPGLSNGEAQHRSVAALSSVLFIGFFPRFYGAASPAGLRWQRTYVNTVVDGLVATVKAPASPRSRSRRRR